MAADLEARRVGDRAIKDLLDAFASQLLTAGVQLGYVSQQLRHADVSVTARHYARWVGDSSYRSPKTLEPAEVPADLLARLSPHSPSDAETAENPAHGEHSAVQEAWRARQDSNL
jgi:hypothetical protein